jgi:hypothetical protein
MAVEKAYLQKIMSEAGVPDEQAQALLGNEKLTKTLVDGFSRQEDYSRNMDLTAAEKKKAEEAYAANQKWYQDNLARLAEAEELRAKFGQQPDPNAGQGIDPSRFVSREAFEKAVNDARISAINANVEITKHALRAMDDYRTRFNKALDLDGLQKYALELNLPLNVAYEKFIQPDAEAKAKADEEIRITKAVQERVQAELSKHNLPVDAGPKEPHLMFDPLPTDKVPGSDRERMAAFAEAWNTTAPR